MSKGFWRRLTTDRWADRFYSLRYTYGAIILGLAACLATKSVYWDTLNFWLTALVAFLVVTFFELFILSMLDEEKTTPSQFLFRMMIVVITMQTAFALIYYWAPNAHTYLARDGRPITDFVDAFYFSGVTLFTVGYGDIVPVGDFRFTAVAEVYGGTIFIFAFFTWGLGIMSDRHLRRPRESDRSND